MRPIDIRKYKQELRLACRQRRGEMDPARKTELDGCIAANVRKLKEYRPSGTLLIYMSTPIEVDTVEIIKNAWADGKRVAIPRCIPDTRDMEFHYIDSFEQVSPGAFSVLEPDPTLPIVTDFSGCLMIVPGMQFDMKGYRIGYGKGYYDRYMVRFTGISAGICYSDELKPFMYHGRFDRKVDIVVTDKRIKTCNSK
ncbi:MAG: 5-formyltetrahydrofolate cyclo-ligase [Acutalibacteraceae bacterium]|nr:5-formyltetrahydrofolate cyclo-ligase [Acutalibacteraceae bacterium]